MRRHDGELCEADHCAAEAQVEHDTLMADGEAAIRGSASLFGHVGGGGDGSRSGRRARSEVRVEEIPLGQ